MTEIFAICAIHISNDNNQSFRFAHFAPILPLKFFLKNFGYNSRLNFATILQYKKRNRVELALVNLYENLPYLAAFLAGILTFLSPCVLPLIPPYMSYIGGVSVSELKVQNRFFIFQKAALFVAGFSVVFIMLGISFNSLLGRFLSNPIANYIAGGIIIIFGIHFLGIFRLAILYQTKRFDFVRIAQSAPFLRIIAPFILGVGFALGWSPCVGPILGSIIALNSISVSGGGVALLVIYALGLGVPFLLTALLIERIFSVFERIKRYYRVIEIISGALLVGIGVVIILGGLDRIAAIFS